VGEGVALQEERAVERAEIERPEDMSQEQLARFLVDLVHRVMVHHTLWFREVEYQLGMPQALDILQIALTDAYNVQMRRFSKVFGFEMEKGIPKPLLEMPREKLIEVIDNLALNWLAVDGVWFQAVERTVGMFDAKRCNDTCWTRFSPFEAWSIKRLLGLPDQAGLEGLKKALRFRLYSRINVQTIIDESPNSIIFQMNDCRVQSARKSKGLEDYPCKSAGVVEYRPYASTIDSRIKTECIDCPPDEHPEEWWCAWRFYIPSDD